MRARARGPRQQRQAAGRLAEGGREAEGEGQRQKQGGGRKQRKHPEGIGDRGGLSRFPTPKAPRRRRGQALV